MMNLPRKSGRLTQRQSAILTLYRDQGIQRVSRNLGSSAALKEQELAV
jgi:hypothetical protein